MGRAERWEKTTIRRLTVLYAVIGAAATVAFVALLLWRLA
jgi:hypothetical protein